MKTNLKAIALSIVMAGTLAITSILHVSIENTVQAKSNKIQYNNSIFTDKLYKKTAMIEFNNKKTKDKKTIKKVYKLLANMKLETKEPDGKIRYGFVYVTLKTKKGKKLTYFFQNGEVHTESKEYIIVDNDPLDGIRKIYKSMKR